MKVYLDNNATTKIDPNAYELMLLFLNEFYGNPSSLHQWSNQTNHVLREVMDKLYGMAWSKCR